MGTSGSRRVASRPDGHRCVAPTRWPGWRQLEIVSSQPEPGPPVLPASPSITMSARLTARPISARAGSRRDSCRARPGAALRFRAGRGVHQPAQHAAVLNLGPRKVEDTHERRWHPTLGMVERDDAPASTGLASARPGGLGGLPPGCLGQTVGIAPNLCEQRSDGHGPGCCDAMAAPHDFPRLVAGALEAGVQLGPVAGLGWH